MLKMSDLKEKTEEELHEEHRQLDKEIFSMRNELRINRKLEQPHLLKEKKKDRARVLTALNQKRS